MAKTDSATGMYLSGKLGIAYHLPANPSGGLAASEAGGGIGHAIAGAYRIPVLERAGATNVTLRD